MKREEAIYCLKAQSERCSEVCEECPLYGQTGADHCCEEALQMAITALQIGTVEECQKSVEICKSMIERNITPENMEEYLKFEDECISKGFTFNSLLEAREKQTAKKPDYEGDGYSDGQLVYDTWICPSCGQNFEVDYDSYDYCPSCGQKIRLE